MSEASWDEDEDHNAPDSQNLQNVCDQDDVISIEALAESFMPCDVPKQIIHELCHGRQITDKMLDLDYFCVTLTPDQLPSVAPSFLLCAHVQQRYIMDRIFKQWEYPVVICSSPFTLAFPDESIDRPLRRDIVRFLDGSISCYPAENGVGLLLSQRHIHTDLLLRAIQSVQPRLTHLRLIGYGMKLPFMDLLNSNLWNIITSADESSVFDIGRTVRCEEILLFRKPITHSVNNVQHYPMLYKLGQGAGGSVFSIEDFPEIDTVKFYSEFAHRVKSHSNIQFDFPKRVRSLRGKQAGLLNLIRHLKETQNLGGFRIEVRIGGRFLDVLDKVLQNLLGFRV